jgi:LmbE family N-acetylglucosaminyl deacetylase/glycosyltransferase involved in cell wall biosynthesis
MKPDIRVPGVTTEIRARRALVLAPHADDDVLGCGGLLTKLAAEGTAIRVLFLTDSSGGDEVTEDRQEYAERRRHEATAALQVLGIHDAEFLDLPDGQLDQYLSLAAGAIEREIVDFRPDVLLSVSPLEVTTDHQAAFAALHRALTGLRGGSDLDEAAADLRILLYEINHPGHPDVLVDVSAEVQDLTEAIKKHASQLQLHNYLKAAIGIRRFRTLSLPTSVTAAEGYRSLKAADFVTHSVAGLIRALGGCPAVHEVEEGPAISVVVRTKDRPDLLRQALDSLASGSYRNVQVVLVNDGGEAPELPEGYPFEIELVDLAENRGRAEAANAGVAAANGDYVAFLDDDDLAEPEHLATLARLVSAPDVRVAYTDAAVGVYTMDADEGWRQVERRLPYSRDFDPDLLLCDNYIPFNTLLIERRLLDQAGPFDGSLPFFEDWDLLIRLSRLAPFHHLPLVTCEYRHFRGGGRHIFGERPAADRSDFFAVKGRVIERYLQYQTPETLARVIGRLRDEAVASREESAARAAEAARLRQSTHDLAEAYHRVNGERDSIRMERDGLAAEHARLSAEVERLERHATAIDVRLRQLFGDDDVIRGAMDETEEHLARTYQEIDRLNTLVRQMEGTKAWRLHRFLERLRGRGGSGG